MRTAYSTLVPDPLAASQAAALRVLSARDLDHLAYTLQDVLAAVEGAYLAYASGVSDNPPPLCMRPPDGRSMVRAMLGREGERETVGVRTSYRSSLPGQGGTERDRSTLLLHDDRSGLPIVLMDGGLVGSLRTPASSALLARACASPDARTALVVGCGAQARMALPLLVQAMPQLQRLIVHGHHAAGLDAVLASMRKHHPRHRVEVSTQLRRAAEDADILIGAAGPSSREAVQAEWLRPGALAILVGHGIDKRALHIADYRIATCGAQMRVTGTDLAQDGRLPEVDAELPAILARRQPGRCTPQDRVFAYNCGMVITDIALGRMLAERAIAQGLGRTVDLW